MTEKGTESVFMIVSFIFFFLKLVYIFYLIRGRGNRERLEKKGKGVVFVVPFAFFSCVLLLTFSQTGSLQRCLCTLAR